MSPNSEAKPVINITPLIDVLLVLLIIFMVIAPLKPSRFKAAVPAEPGEDHGTRPNPLTLIVSIKHDQTLALNHETNMGTVNEPEALVTRLKEVFDGRAANGVPATANWRNTDNAPLETVEKTVFIKAPRTIKYGEIAKVVDSLKGAGAAPIAFQIDDID